jgi:dTDP-4-amino-4,6-dideoxygalactose transaminase
MNNITYKRSSYGEYSKESETGFLGQLIKNRKHILGFSGRTVIYDIFASLQIPVGSSVLLPEFYPEGLKLPLERMGMNIITYSLNEDFSPSLKGIESLIEPNRIKVAFLIHYFGKSYDFGKVIETLSSVGIYVIEDCAQSLFNYINREYKYKSVILYSFPKFISVPSGALAVFNVDPESVLLTSGIASRKDSIIASFSVAMHRISLIMRKFQRSAGNKFIYIPVRLLATVFYILYYKSLCRIKSSVPISRSVYDYLRHFDFNEFMKLRSLNYRIIVENLKFQSTGDTIKSDVNYMGFVAMTSQQKRDSVIRSLKEDFIDVLCYQHGWIYQKSSRENPIELSKSFFIIPVNEHIKPSTLLDAIKNINVAIEKHGAIVSKL